jgi:cardiolipin synthase
MSESINCKKIKALSISSVQKDIFKKHSNQEEKWHSVDLDIKIDTGKNSKSTYSKFLDDLNNAQKSIYLESGFFTPNKEILAALKNKNESNLDVSLITNAPYFGYWMGTLTTCASLKFQEEVLDFSSSLSSIKLFYPKDGLSTHSKIMVIDDEIISLGSFNVHEKSFSWNAETWITIKNFDDTLLFTFKNIMANRLANSRKIINPKDFYNKFEIKKNITNCQAVKKLARLVRPFI